MGISYYLKKVDFEQLIMNMSEIMSEGSAICFDYPSVDESVETRKTQMLASGAGTDECSGLSRVVKKLSK